MTPSSNRIDPLRAHSFRVEIDGIAAIGFSEISGLHLTIDAIEYRDGADPGAARVIPGQARHSPLVLRRGAGPNRDLWRWIAAVRDGATERRDVAVIVQNENREDVLRVRAREAWPSAWRLGDLDAHSSAIVIEELTLRHEGLVVDD